MYDVVTFGEAMIRLSPPHFQRLEQTQSLDLNVGGAELNVAVGVTRLGMRSAWVLKSFQNAGGLHDYGVGVAKIPRKGDLMYESMESLPTLESR